MFEGLSDYDKVAKIRQIIFELAEDAREEAGIAWDSQEKIDYDLWTESLSAYTLTLSLIDRAFPE